MFNFGWGEIVLIGIVALIAIGPKELPTVLRSVGQMMAKVRRMAAEFQGQFQEALREAEIADLKKQAEDLTSAVKSQVSDFAQIDGLAETKKDIEKAFDEPAGAPTSTAADFTSAPVTPVETTDALPPVEQGADLTRIDLPVPEPLSPPRSEDFAAREPAPDTGAADKKAGGAG